MGQVQQKSPRGTTAKDLINLLLKVTRWVLAALSVGIFLVALVYTTYQYIRTNYRYSATSVTVLHDIPYNDLTDGGIQMRLNVSNSIFQVGLLVFAGLGGILLAREGEAKLVLGDVPELLMLIIAGASLIASFVWYGLYLSEISYLYQVAINLQDSNPTIPDVFHPSVGYLFICQLSYFVCGLVVGLFTFLSTHKLRGIKK